MTTDATPPVPSTDLLEVFKDGRPLTHPLDAYWRAPSGHGPLAAEWSDKPHRLVYGLVSSIVHSTGSRAATAASSAAPAVSARSELDKLRREYRPSMSTDVLHAWAGDIVSALKRLESPSAEHVAGEDLECARSLAADEAWLNYDFGYPVEDAEGWERTVPGDEWTRKVYFTADERGEPSITGSFTVHFQTGTATVDKASASCNGQDIGNPL